MEALMGIGPALIATAVSTMAAVVCKLWTLEANVQKKLLKSDSFKES